MSGAGGLAVALGLPFLAGWFLVGAACRDRDGSLPARAGRTAAAVLVGLGLSSLLAFAWLLGGGVLGRGYVVADAAFLAALAVAGVALAPRLPRLPRGGAPRPALDAVALVVLCAALALSAVAFVRAVEAIPHGEWDAWSIWNLRARFLYRGGAAWRDAFSADLAWSQTGYPLLVPLAVARAWAYAGESTAAPAAIAGVLALAATLALGGAVARRAGNVAGAVAALLLLATAQLVQVAAAQYADVAVAAYLVAGLGALLEAAGAEGAARAGGLAVAGLLLGLGGWAKNEGIAAAACAGLAYLAVGPGRPGRRLADLVPVALGAALPAAAWLVFHGVVEARVAPALAGAAGGPGLARLAAPGRLPLILAALWARLPGREQLVPLAALAAAALLGVRPGRLARSMPLVAAALLLAVDVLVYLATPQDLAWHLASSAERVLFQAWPALLLGLFAARGAVASAGAAG